MNRAFAILTAKSQMISIQKNLRLTWLCCFLAVLMFQAEFSRSLAAEAPAPQARQGSGTLTPVEAAKLAARLANDECERLYKKRPFTAKPYRAVRRGDRYRWGRLDVTAPGGFSALVTFATDGTDPKVEVYFSTDILTPPK
jgi:hypothetical protein